MGPGQTAFTRIPSAAWSIAIPRVSPATAALVVSYWVVLPMLVTDRTEAKLTMLLGAACRRSGIAAFAQNAYPCLLLIRPVGSRRSPEVFVMEPTHAGTSTTLPWLGGCTLRGSGASLANDKWVRVPL